MLNRNSYKQRVFLPMYAKIKVQKSSLRWCWLSLLVIIIDQFTKYLAVNHLMLYHPKAITPFLNFTLMYNPGAAFSFLNRTGSLALWLFSLIALVVSVFIILWLKKIPANKPWLACGLALVLGGALGNLCDRFIYGYVIDFVDFYLHNWHFFVFNIADAAITFGAVLLFVDAFFLKKN